MRSLLAVPAALVLLTAAWSVDPPPANQIRELSEQPKRFIGRLVTVELSLTGEVTPAADRHPELDVTATGVALDRLKFRATASLAYRVPDTGATHEEPLPARLVGRVLGPEAAGRGRYVIQVEEVQLLGPNGQVEDTLTPKAAAKPESKPAPIEEKAEPKPEPGVAPAAVEVAPARPEAGLPVLPIAAGGGAVLLAVGGGVVLLARRRKPAVAPVVERPTVVEEPAPTPAATDTGPLSVSDRLSRRAR